MAIVNTAGFPLFYGDPQHSDDRLRKAFVDSIGYMFTGTAPDGGKTNEPDLSRLVNVLSDPPAAKNWDIEYITRGVNLDPVPEGAEIPASQLFDLPPKVLPYKTYADRVQYTHQARVFRRGNMPGADTAYDFLQEGFDLASRYHAVIRNLILGVYKDAFTGAVYTGFHNRKLVDTAQPLKGGGTTSNKMTLALSEEGVQQALTMLETQVNWLGQPIGASGKVLVVPSALKFEALRITRSIERRPVTGQGTNNPIQAAGYGLEVLSFPSLGAAFGGSDTAWFLIDPTIINIQMAIHPSGVEFIEGVDVRTGVREKASMVEMGIGFGTHEGVVGSTGETDPDEEE